jgi:glycosyltransferase involved in cell wall biosynthesis
LTDGNSNVWRPGSAPVAVVMISLNEGHNMRAVLDTLQRWAQEVFLVDSFSRDDTVDIALAYGVHVVQRRFRGFGDQWNFALRELPITAPYTMKVDPDERLSEDLKSAIIAATARGGFDGLKCNRRWWFMGRPLPITENILRLWRTGSCRFSDVLVNEHPIVDGKIASVAGNIEHLDSSDLTDWFEKQNRYSTAEAIMAFQNAPMAAEPKLLGNELQRRMWLKRMLGRLPLQHHLLFLYYYFWKGTWRAGKVGYVSARLWSHVWRMRELKLYEMALTGRIPVKQVCGAGAPHPRVRQFE